ncbi:MAG: LuxR C-terminal-related transcriptional regulator [Sphingomonadaceae bacterium]
MLDAIRQLTEAALAAPDAVTATRAFNIALKPHGATYLQTRAYRRPTAPLTAKSHWDAGGFVARHARPGWIGSAAHKHICIAQNPLIEPIRRGMTRYRFGEFAPQSARSFAPYWDAMREGDIAEALCATANGPERRIASVHIGFDRRAFAPGEDIAIQLAGMILVEKLVDEADVPDAAAIPRLTVRERDAISYVAEGKTDWEIAKIMGVSEATARFHVDNARRKLGGVNRAHAVARFLALNPF